MSLTLNDGKVTFGNGAKTVYVIDNTVFGTEADAVTHATTIFKTKSVAEAFVKQLTTYMYFDYVNTLVEAGNGLSDIVSALKTITIPDSGDEDDEESGEEGKASLTFTVPITKLYHGKANNAIDINVTGNVGTKLPVKVALSLTDVQIDSQNTKEVSGSTLDEIKNGLKGLVLTPTKDTGNCSMTITATDSETTEIGKKEQSLTIVKAGKLNMNQDLDNKILVLNQYKELGALKFTSADDVTEATTWKVVLTPTNCVFKISDSDSEHNSAHTVNGTNLNDLNTKISKLSVKGTKAGDAKIAVAMTVDTVSTNDELNYTVNNVPDLIVNDSSANKTLTVGEDTSIGALTLDGTEIAGGSKAVFTITPVDFTLKGLASGADTPHDAAFEFEATNKAAFNTEFAACKGNVASADKQPKLKFVYKMETGDEEWYTSSEQVITLTAQNAGG